MQNEFNKFCANSKHVLLLGDYNSRTSSLDDFVLSDEFICDIFGDDDLFRESLDTFQYFDKYHIPLLRKSADIATNPYGHQLLDFCKNNNLFIINGRLGQDAVLPQLTCKNSSTVDYILSSSQNFEILSFFAVLEFDHLFSDAHCPLTLELKIRGSDTEMNPHIKIIQREPEVKLWDENKKNLFIENLNLHEISTKHF